MDGTQYSLSGVSNATWGANAGLTASFDTCVGLCGTLAIGVTGTFRVLDISFTPTIQSKQTTIVNGDATYSWSNRASIDLTTMDGKASVWADLLGVREEHVFVDWDGYSDSWSLWGHSGSTTCTGYRNRPSNDCWDVYSN